MNRAINFDTWTLGQTRAVTAPLHEGFPLVRLIATVTETGAAVGRLIERQRPFILGSFVVDTGASATCVCSEWIKPLRLLTTGHTPIQTATTGDAPQQRPLHELSLFIPNNQRPGDGKVIGDGLLLEAVKVTASNLPRKVNGLIGRDVLDKCTLVYDGPAKCITLRY